MKYVIDHDLHIHSLLSSCSRDPEQNTEAILRHAEEPTTTKTVLRIERCSILCINTSTLGPLWFLVTYAIGHQEDRLSPKRSYNTVYRFEVFP